VGEELDVRVKLTTPDGAPITGAQIRLVIQEKSDLLLSDVEGEAQTRVTFAEKGTYKVESEYAAGRLHASRRLRVVEYRDEIIDLFNSKFKEAEQRFKALRDNHTARELLEYLRKETPAEAHGAVSEMVYLFEEANYSLHPVRRRLYERFYLAMRDYEEASRGE
jgi:hypothetical protein